jgi:hypothetical protein
VISLSGVAALALVASTARADRLAVVAFESPDHAAPAVEAESLAAELAAHGHRVIASSDTLARVTAENQGAGADWAAKVLQSIGAARAALTRLDRALALGMANSIGEDIVRRGGGMGGPEVLVEWCLLQRQIALTSQDEKEAARWLDTAVAFGPDIELDPLQHPDDERDLFARRRAALKAEVVSALSIATVPAAAADVWVDGVRRCSSPCTVPLLPGRHLARTASPAYAPAVLDVQVAPGLTTQRRLGLTAAYSGASPKAIATMLADPSRRNEGASALEPLARFLDVDHVVALVPEGSQIRVLIAPAPQGRSRLGPAVAAANLPPTVIEQLRPIAPPPPPEESKSIFKKPVTWIAGAGIVAAVVGGIFIYDASRSQQKTGSITVR